jgi:hypothetical protein
MCASKTATGGFADFARTTRKGECHLNDGQKSLGWYVYALIAGGGMLLAAIVCVVWRSKTTYKNAVILNEEDADTGYEALVV